MQTKPLSQTAKASALDVRPVGSKILRESVINVTKRVKPVKMVIVRITVRVVLMRQRPTELLLTRPPETPENTIVSGQVSMKPSNANEKMSTSLTSIVGIVLKAVYAMRRKGPTDQRRILASPA